MKNIIGFICFMLLAAVIYYYSTAPIEFEEPQETLAKVVKFQSTSRSGSDNVLEYYVNNIPYKAYLYKSSGDQIGDVYPILYEKNHPRKYKILKDEITFEKNERTAVTIGEVVHVERIGKDWLRYIITVEGKEYTRSQSFNEDTYHPKVGEEYEVEFLKTNPKRAVLNLSKRVK